MKASKDFDRFMVVNEIAGNPKVARLTDAEFRCLIQGVWPLASKSRPRGYLLVGSLPANEKDIANQARCSVAIAKRTMAKLRELEMVVADSELGAERCHDWDEINPSPKADATNAERQRRYRQRLVTLRNAVTNGDVTPGEVEVEVEEEVTAAAAGRASTSTIPNSPALHPSLPEVVQILEQARRPDGGALVVEPASINSMILANPDRDQVRAAHETAAVVQAGANRSNNATSLYGAVLRRMSAVPPPESAKPDHDAVRARRHAALKRVMGEGEAA